MGQRFEDELQIRRIAPSFFWIVWVYTEECTKTAE